VEKITSDFKFEKCGEAKYKIRGNKMQITLPRALCELYGKLSFNFKWVDNIDLSDACNLTTDGDTAPNGRFSYQYIEK
jgi:hypothetical protein